MLTGRVPFDAESAVTIALKHVSEAPAPSNAINPAVPPELEQVVMWALNKNPADRPTDADQFINALEAAKTVIQSGESGQRTASMAALAVVGGVGAAYGSPAAGGAGVSPETAIAAYRRPAGDDTGSYYVDGEPREPPTRRAAHVAVGHAAGDPAAGRRGRSGVPAHAVRTSGSSRR